MERGIFLTGIRPTGRMHMGHYFGFLRGLVERQGEGRCFFMVADYQALTSQRERAGEIEDYVRETVLDLLAAGFDPERGICFLQSQVPQLAELTTILGNLVPLSSLLRNPTIREEMEASKQSATYGFVGYPVSQAADVLLFRPVYVPVGPDQRPHLELAQEVAHRFNRMFGPVFPVPEGVYGDRLAGTDGKRKMGKSDRNTVDLAEDGGKVAEKVAGMVTDPGRVRRSDPGHPEVCTVYRFHRMLDTDAERVVAEPCRRAAVGCCDCKAALAEKVNVFLEPFRQRRAALEGRPGLIRDVLHLGASEARIEGQRTLEVVKEAMGLRYRRLLG